MLHNWIKSSTHGFPKKCLKNCENSDIVSPKSVVRRNALATRQNYTDDWFASLAKMPSHYCHKLTERIYLEGPFKDLEEIYYSYKNI